MKKINKNVMTQIGILTKDIKKSKEAWENFLGLSKQPIFKSDSFDQAQGFYRGEQLNGLIYQVCFNFDNIELELIQPIGDTPSFWRECLDENGEGLHHISFAVKDMEENISDCEALDMTLTQKGEFEGGRYAYLDAKNSLNVILELVEKENEEI